MSNYYSVRVLAYQDVLVQANSADEAESIAFEYAFEDTWDCIREVKAVHEIQENEVETYRQHADVVVPEEGE